MKAIISGVVIEGILLALMFSGVAEGGSCKPEGFGLSLIMLHYPAIILQPYLPPLFPFLIAVALCVVAWSAVVYVLLRLVQFGKTLL
ncbi:hypothetical protein [Prosthecobacter sp.]|uniref:hypothetical protein n=1 Tax=Prosthecobacter sp. TaxID=1965333 RepID=UPI002486EA72|nr:hypothetical protein [Prosthecobacter sp.]MDI1315071.1 hypothetical protein [Prosthecobacter sp.]